MLAALRGSLRAKVIAIVLITTLAALLVSAAALLSYEIDNYRDFLISDVTTQADLIARTSAPALAFNDPEAARANLALLETRPGFVAAAIYTPDGEIFASYSRARPPAPVPAASSSRTPLISGGSLSLFHPVVENDNVLGTVYVRAGYDLADRIADYLLILVAVTAASLFVALLVSFSLAGSVTRPVLAVANVARQVIDKRDFTLRAHKTTQDESGILVDAFNAMLSEVDQRAEALENSNRLLKQETEERRNAEAALRLADQRKDEFLATLAHELRNPLAPMVNAISILETPGVGESISQRAREMIARQLAQLVRLVDDLLDVSRITSGKLIIRKETVDLAAVVDYGVDTVRPLLDARGHELVVSLPAEPVHLDADAVRLAQVFSNLLNNAAKYSDTGGKIALRAVVMGDSVRIDITDDGAGMSAETLPRIFEMFSQGDSSVERAQAGLGVGLALAKRLIELHGGTIEGRSPGIGKGSVFTVSLPIEQPSSAKVLPPPTPVSTGGRAHRILLVDDNVDFVTSLSLLLRAMGHDVRVAHDAPEAVEVARQFRPEFGFLDLGLPRVSGYALARELHKLPETADTILIALSGWGQQHHREQSGNAGFALHLVKPVELEQIRSALDSLVSEIRA